MREEVSEFFLEGLYDQSRYNEFRGCPVVLEVVAEEGSKDAVGGGVLLVNKRKYSFFDEPIQFRVSCGGVEFAVSTLACSVFQTILSSSTMGACDEVVERKTWTT